MTTTTDGLNKAAEYIELARVALRDASIDARPVVFAGIAAVQDMLGFQSEMIANVIEISDEGDASDSWIADFQADARLRRDDPEAWKAQQQAEYDAQMQAFFARFGDVNPEFYDAEGNTPVTYVGPEDAVSVTLLDGGGKLTLEPYQVIDGVEFTGSVVQGPDSVSD